MILRQAISAFVGCALLVGSPTPGRTGQWPGASNAPRRVVVTGGLGGQHGISRERLARMLTNQHTAVEAVNGLGSEQARLGKLVALYGIEKLGEASQGRPGSDAEVAFLRLVHGALNRAVPAPGTAPGRLFHHVAFEHTEGSEPRPYLVFADSASTGAAWPQSWFLSFGTPGRNEAGRIADPRFAELLFPLGIPDANGNRRVQQVKIRLTTSHNPHSPVPPVLSIQSPSAHRAVAAVKDALDRQFGLRLE